MSSSSSKMVNIQFATDNAAKLRDPSVADADLQTIASSIFDRVDSFPASETPAVLEQLIPAFIFVLDQRISPEFTDGPRHQIRRTILDAIHRFPRSEAMQPHALQLCHACMSVVRADNEENGLLAVKNIFDLHKHFRSTLEALVPTTMEYLMQRYRSFPALVAQLPTLAQSTTAIAMRSDSSFRVLTEWSMLALLLLQTHADHSFITNHLAQLASDTMVALQANLQVGTPDLKNSSVRFEELLACQVKALYFLFHVLRHHARLTYPADFYRKIATAIVSILKECPPTTASVRRDLFVAARHMIQSPNNEHLVEHVGVFLNESVLLGNKFYSKGIRALAYSTLADVLIKARQQLTLDQLTTVTHIFCRNICDEDCPVPIQATSVRLILNLVDFIYNNASQQREIGRGLLLRILDTMVRRFGSLRRQIPKVVRATRQEAKEKVEAFNYRADLHEQLIQAAEWCESAGRPSSGSPAEVAPCPAPALPSTVVPKAKQPDDLDVPTTDPLECSLRDIRHLIRPMVMGMKTVLWCICHYRVSHTTAEANQPEPLQEPELKLISKFLQWGLECLSLFVGHVSTQAKDQNEVLDCFAGAFTVLSAPTFRDVFHGSMFSIFQHIVVRTRMLQFVQHFLANVAAAKPFLDILLEFHSTHLHYLSSDTAGIELQKRELPPVDSLDLSIDQLFERTSLSARASAMLRLFKLAAGSVTHVFPDNEAVVQPYIQKLVRGTIREAFRVRRPLLHLFLLRALFRSVAAGKFELWFKEFPPLLPSLIEDLMLLHDQLDDKLLRNLLMELCLIVPARLGTQLPHLHHLMRPLTLALQSQDDRGEVVSVGLKTLEFWIDNLNPAFLYPILEAKPVYRPLMAALCSLLKPPPAPSGSDALRVMGKMGGLNRRFLALPQPQVYNENVRDAVTIQAQWKAAVDMNMPAEFSLSLDEPLQLMVDILRQYHVMRNAEDSESTPQESGEVADTQPSFTKAFEPEPCPDDILPGEELPPWKSPPNVDQATAQNDVRKRGCMRRGQLHIKTKAWNVVDAVVRLLLRSSTAISAAQQDEVLKYDHCTAQRVALEAHPFTRPIRNLFLCMALAASDEDLAAEATPRLLSTTRILLQHMCVANTATNSSVGSATAAAPEEDGDEEMKDATDDDTAAAADNAQGQQRHMLFHPGVIFTCILDILQEKSAVLKIGLKLMNTVRVFLRKQRSSQAIPANTFEDITLFLVAQCHGAKWQAKLAVCELIAQMVGEFHTDNIADQASALVGGCMYVLRNLDVSNYNQVMDAAHRAASAVSGAAFGIFIDPQQSSKIATDIARQVTAGAFSAAHPSFGTTGSEATAAAGAGATPSTAASSSSLPPQSQVTTQVASQASDQASTATSMATTAAARSSMPNSTGLSSQVTIQTAGSVMVSQIPTQITVTAPAITTPVQSGASASMAASTTSTSAALGTSSTPAGTSADNAAPASPAVKLDSLVVKPDVAENVSTGRMNVIEVLVRNMAVKRRPAILAAQHILQQLIKHLQTDWRTIMAPWAEALRKALLHRDFAGMTEAERVGMLLAVSNVLTLEPMLFASEHTRLIRLLTHALDATQEFGTDNLGPPDRTGEVQATVFAEHELLMAGYVELPQRTPGYHVQITQPKPVPPEALRYHVLLRVGAIELLRTSLKPWYRLFDGIELLDKYTNLILDSLRVPAEVVTQHAKAALQEIMNINRRFEKKPLCKEQLEQSLKPVMKSLGQPNLLTVNLLDAMSRLLQLLSSAFNNTMGERFLTHLRSWQKPKDLLSTSNFSGKQAVEIAVHIVDLFHVFPPCEQLVPDLVTAVVEVEAVLHQFDDLGYASAPLRPPLARCCSRYAHQALDFFWSQPTLAKPGYGALFVEMLKLPHAKGLRAALTKEEGTDRFLEKVFRLNEEAMAGQGRDVVSLMHRYGVAIVEAVSRKDATWLQRCPQVVDTLRKLWALPAYRIRLMSPTAPRVAENLAEIRQILKVFIRIVKLNPDDLRAMFSLLLAFVDSVHIDLTFVREFFQIELPKIARPEHKVRYLQEFFVKSNQADGVKLHAMRMVVIPVLRETYVQDAKVAASLRQGMKLAERQQLTAAATAAASASPAEAASKPGSKAASSSPADEQARSSSAADAGTSSGAASQSSPDVAALRPRPSIPMSVLSELIAQFLNDRPNGSEEFQIELIQLATIVTRYLGTVLGEGRREIIRFAWQGLKGKENEAKFWAYITVCHSIAVSDAPQKIIQQVYVSLLRSVKADYQHIVRRALDILSSQFSSLLDAEWELRLIRWTKRIILDDSHSALHIAHAWHQVVRHSDFYEKYSTHFIAAVVNSLTKLGLTAQSPVHHRELAVDLATLLTLWETKRCVAQASAAAGDTPATPAESADDSMDTDMKDAAAGDEESASAPVTRRKLSTDSTKSQSSADRKRSPFTPQMASMLIHFVIREALLTADSEETRFISRRCISLLKVMLKLWPNPSLKFVYFQRLTSRSSSSGSSEPSDATLAAIAEVLLVLVRSGLESFIIDNIGMIMMTLMPAFVRTDSYLHYCLRELIATLLTKHKIERPAPKLEAARFYPFVVTLVSLRLGLVLGLKKDELSSKVRKAAEATEATGQSKFGEIPGDPEATASDEWKENVAALRNAWDSKRIKTIADGSPDEMSLLRMLQLIDRITIEAPTFIEGLLYHLGRLMSTAVGQPYDIVEKPGGRQPQATERLVNLPNLHPQLELSPKENTIRQLLLRLLIRSLSRRVLFHTRLKSDFFRHIVTVFHRSQERDVIWTALHVASEWLNAGAHLSHSTAYGLVQREKVNLLSNMSTMRITHPPNFATSGAGKAGMLDDSKLAIQAAFMKILLRLYRGDDHDGRAPAWLKHFLQRTVISGFMSCDPDIRDECFNLLIAEGAQKRVDTKKAAFEDNNPADKRRLRHMNCTNGRSAFGAMESILWQDWEPVAVHMWLPIAVQMFQRELEGSDTVAALDADLNAYGVVSAESLCGGVHRGEEAMEEDEPEGPEKDDGAKSTDAARNRPAASVTSGKTGLDTMFTDDQGDVFVNPDDLALPTVQEIMAPLAQVAYASPRISRRLWISLFGSAWAAITPPQRVFLTPHIASLLVRDFHQHQLLSDAVSLTNRVMGLVCRDLVDIEDSKRLSNQWGSNVVQLLLEGVLSAYPMPALRPEVLKYVAKTYCAWTIVIPVLETQTIMFDRKQVFAEALSELYGGLSELDQQIALQRRFCVEPESAWAMGYEAHGKWVKAQEIYNSAIRRAASTEQRREKACDMVEQGLKQRKLASGKRMGVEQQPDLYIEAAAAAVALAQMRQPEPTFHATGSDAANAQKRLATALRATATAVPRSISAFELTLWESRWVETARQLCQWPVLNDYARNVGDTLLMAEACSKLGQWTYLQRLLQTPAVTLDVARAAVSKLYDVEIAIQHDRPSEAANLCDQAAMLALRQWCALPSLGLHVHECMLTVAQRVVECREAVSVAHAIRSSMQSRNMPDMKAVLDTWRERLPNRWDGLTVWDALLTWRHHVFSFVTTSLQSQPHFDAQQVAGAHDAPWTVIKLAHTARKLGLNDVCVTTLARLYQLNTMEVHDAFHKLREQIMVCLDSPDQRRGALSVLNGTNIDYFNPQQQAELFRLKGVFLEMIGNDYLEAAHATFSHAQQLCSTYAKGWLSWGQFLDRLFMHVVTQRSAKQSQPIINAARLVLRTRGSTESQPVYIAEEALCCYLRAVRFHCICAPLQLARVLCILAHDNDDGVLGRALQVHSEDIPTDLWLTWVPQLLTSLFRPEGQYLTSILDKVVRDYPEALYYSLRAYFLERKELPADPAPAAPSAVPGQPQPPRVFTARDFGQRLIVQMQKLHPVKFTLLEAMIEDVLAKGKLNLDEDLCSALQNFLQKAYSRADIAPSAPVPAQHVAFLRRIAQKLVNTTARSTQPPLREQLYAKYKEEFFPELLASGSDTASNPDNSGGATPTAPTPTPSAAQDDEAKLDETFGELLDKIRGWKRRLLRETARTVHLQDLSTTMAEIPSNALQIPGQYVACEKPDPHHAIMIQSVKPMLSVTWRFGSAARRYTFIGSDGEEHGFVLQFVLSHSTRTDERSMQLMMVLNFLFKRHQDCRRRRLMLGLPTVVPLMQRARLHADNSDLVPLSNVLQEALAGDDLCADDELIRYFQTTLHALDGNRMEAYRRTCAAVPETALVEYIGARMETPDALAILRSRMSHQWGSMNFVNYFLSVHDRTPNKIAFSIATGDVVNAECRPAYDRSGHLYSAEPGTFRLTRTIQAFMTPFGIDGPFAATFSAGARCCSKAENWLHPYLTLYLKDDQLAWNLTNSAPVPESEHRILDKSTTFKDAVQRNVRNTLLRIRDLSPSPSTPRGTQPASEDHPPASNLVVATYRKLRESNAMAESPNQNTSNFNGKIFSLIAKATAPEHLSRMAPAWHPWF